MAAFVLGPNLPREIARRPLVEPSASINVKVIALDVSCSGGAWLVASLEYAGGVSKLSPICELSKALVPVAIGP